MKKINKIILLTSCTILLICAIFNVWIFYSIEPPVFNTVISATIVGTDEHNISVEMTIDIDNTSKIPFKITDTDIFFYDFENTIARVHLVEETFINALSNTIIKINACIQKETFENLMINAIEQYSFHLVGNIQTKVFFIPKHLKVNKYVAVDVNSLLTKFITDSFKNSIVIDDIRFINESNFDFMLCNITFLNKAGLHLYIKNFVANVEVNSYSYGTMDFFEPFAFRHHEARKVASARFRFPQSRENLTGIGQYRYCIDGNMIVELWEQTYQFPVEMIGEY